ncbi:MAG TPA: polysaccharide deacetylase family protein [Cyclobacteriaceae bacterium]|nr:polysaccharide deacetylase family protein [Cyclobacteriaceae bacterium]
MNKFYRIVLFVFIIFNSGCSNDHASKRTPGIPDKLVVLTFDDAVKSHRTLVAPNLKELGFGATFFVCYEWMDDRENFLSWQEIGEIHQMGFEIGNHAWNHVSYAQPRASAALEGELGMVNWDLMRVGVPLPVSYAWNGNAFGPESLKVLEDLGYKFARRGMQPEVAYGELKPGPAFDPDRQHRLLIPTTRDGYPEMKMGDFIKAVKKAKNGKIAVLQFHGVPDPAHPWVSTLPEDFKKYMQYLKDNDYKVIAMKDLEQFLPETPPADPMARVRYDLKPYDSLELPDEMIAARNDPGRWLPVMKSFGYTLDEMAAVTGFAEKELSEKLSGMDDNPSMKGIEWTIINPYPGGRHPRINFREGMLSPMRGTKAGIFLPWDPDDYIVLDLPEAVLSQYGLAFLGHKHIPTIFDRSKTEIKNSDWQILRDGGLRNEWHLPNKMTIGAEMHPGKNMVNMELWLRNDTDDTVFADLQTQICIMFKGAEEFDELTNDNKVFDPPYAATRSEGGNRWIITAWERGSHSWGNLNCPCMHADPRLPDCPPGETVRVIGQIWFFEGEDMKTVIHEIRNTYSSVEYKAGRL